MDEQRASQCLFKDKGCVDRAGVMSVERVRLFVGVLIGRYQKGCLDSEGC